MVAPTTISKPDVAPTTAVPTPPRNRWRTAGIIIAWQLIAILFVEGVLALAGLGEEEFFKFDPQIGFMHMSNKRITWRTEGFAQSYLNEDGMREPNLKVAKPANTYRVALLGDSMVEGFQVPIEQTFGAVIGKDISPINGKQVQVLNFACSGYSTAQQWLALRNKAMKYNPDLVLLCYNSRDMFENWSAPDQVITNVRPAAVKLPGYPLTIDHSPVQKWLRTPRARFLQNIEWLRQHSRICGLFMALDLELSQKNLWYRAFVNTVTSPKKGLKEIQKAWAEQQKQGPAFDLNVFNDAGKNAVKPSGRPQDQVAAKPHAKEVLVSASTNESLSTPPAPTVKYADNDPRSPNSTYQKFVHRTLAGLFESMRNIAEEKGAKFAVITLPVRAQLCPLIGMETSFGGIDYPQEIAAVQKICSESKIPYFDVEAAAEKLEYNQREQLFYTVHLTPEGQRFIGETIGPFVKEQLENIEPRK